VAALVLVSNPVQAVAETDNDGPIAAEANPQLFATMCALVASGFEAGPINDPEISQLRARLLALHGPATEAMRDYYRQHAFTDPSETLSRFVTFALVAGPAPNFKPVLRQDQLPPDVASLEGFSQVLANFYQEAQIEQLWRQLQPVYEAAIESMREPLAQLVFASTGYLREIIHPGVRKFRIYVEPMVGGETNVRNIGDTYVVVVNPASPAVDLMRHAFLHFLLDPLPIKYADKLLAEEPLLVIADRAPNLPGEYRADMTSFFTECFVRAVEYRVRKLPPAELAEKINSSDAGGFVLVRPLIKALSKFESSEPAMSLYFPDLLRSIDVVAEQQRLKSVAFAPESQATEPDDIYEKPSAGKQTGSDSRSGLDAELTSAERMIADRDPAAAAKAFEQILQRRPGQPRALYGLAVASVLQGDAERARNLFQQVVDSANADSPELRADPTTLAWSHVYLGRMYDLEGIREEAVNEYHAALAVNDASEAARSAAQSGLQQAYQPAVGNSSPQ
jgi:tetratricopeptide (TPR) repeat protein